MIRLTFQTSGTTGEPKDIVHTLDAMTANAEAFNAVVGLDASTVMYHCLPRTHMAGFLNSILCPTLAGGRVAFGPTFSAQTAGRFWADLFASQANTVWITPTIAAMLLRMGRFAPDIVRSYGSKIRHVFCGTAPLPRRIREEFGHVSQEEFAVCYGTSEHMLVSVQSREQAQAEHNVGTPLPGMKVETRDNGEIFVNGTPTGDQGELRGGHLTITGRLKDLIIRGGFNIIPAKIEDVVRGYNLARDVAVIGQPDDFWGERIVLFVEGGEKATVTAWCRENLPKSHQPDVIKIVDKLPRNGMGKVLKRELA